MVCKMAIDFQHFPNANSYIDAKQKHPGCKKGEANQKQQLSST